jgi:plastocyanin
VRWPAARLVALVVALGVVALAPALLPLPLGPYVVTAIDYHFHDAHPTAPIGPGRDLVVSNAGRNVHNVTIPGLAYGRDVAPGERLTIPDIGGRLAPGRYAMFCVYHRDRAMTGVIVIAGT